MVEKRMTERECRDKIDAIWDMMNRINSLQSRLVNESHAGLEGFNRDLFKLIPLNKELFTDDNGENKYSQCEEFRDFFASLSPMLKMLAVAKQSLLTMEKLYKGEIQQLNDSQV